MTLLEYDGWNDDIWGRAEFLLWFDDWGGLRLKDGASFLMQGKCNKQTKKQKTNKLETNKQGKGKTWFDDWGAPQRRG